MPDLPERGLRADGVSVATRHHPRQDGHHVRTSPAPFAHAQGRPRRSRLCDLPARADALRPATAGRCCAERRDDRGRGPRFDGAHARSASIDGKRFDITPADLGGVTSVDQLSAGVFLGVLDHEAGAAEDVSLPVGRFNLDLAQANGAFTGYAEQGGRVYPAKRTSQMADGPPNDSRPSAAAVAAGGCG